MIVDAYVRAVIAITDGIDSALPDNTAGDLARIAITLGLMAPIVAAGACLIGWRFAKRVQEYAPG